MVMHGALAVLTYSSLNRGVNGVDEIASFLLTGHDFFALTKALAHVESLATAEVSIRKSIRLGQELLKRTHGGHGLGNDRSHRCDRLPGRNVVVIRCDDLDSCDIHGIGSARDGWPGRGVFRDALLLAFTGNFSQLVVVPLRSVSNGGAEHGSNNRGERQGALHTIRELLSVLQLGDRREFALYLLFATS